MKALLIGHLGSIGRRYQAILNHLNIKWQGYDLPEVGVNEPNENDFTHCIVASPTELHREHIARFAQLMPTLCEKPIALKQEDLDILKGLNFKYPVFMVNNYSFLNTNPGFPPRVDKIEYDFYNTGRDGSALDCIQLLFLADRNKAELIIKKDSPVWHLYINDRLEVPYQWIEWTYVQMVAAFMHDRTHVLWPLQFGIEATELALKVQNKLEDKNAGFAWYPGQKSIDKAS